MGGIYPKPEKSATNSRNSAGFPSENPSLNESNFSNVFHNNNIGSTSRPSHNDFGGVFTRSLPSVLSSNPTSFSMPGQRPREKNNEDMLGYRYMTEPSTFQQRNVSMSPNTIIQNQFKHQNYGANLINTLNQNRSAAVMQQMNVTKNESFQGAQLLQSGSKLNVDVVNRGKASNYGINQQQQHVHQSGMFHGNKRPQLLSQPPNKRSRLTNDFVNMAAHHSPNNIQQGHHLSMSQHDSMRISSSPQTFGQKESAIYKGSSTNSAKSHLLEPRGLWQNKEPTYYPQVEAISPVPEDMRNCDLKLFTEKDDINEKLRIVDADIIKQEQNINRLQEKIGFLNSKINQPSIENYSKEEETCTPLSRDPIQSIITENQRKATEQHQLFHKLCSNHVSCAPLALPLYRQQSDVELLVKVKSHFHKTFKPQLIKYIRRRKFADKARMRYLAKSYEEAAKAWYKRLEKSLNSPKRRQKEMKFRELFEKTFPEIKRNREERERENSDYTDTTNYLGDSSGNSCNNGNNHRSLTNNFNGTSSSDNQRPISPYDAVKEMEKMKEYAIDPPLTTAPWYHDHNLSECGNLVKDPKGRHSNYQNYKPLWSRDEIEIFKEQYIISPKNFARIASLLPKKTISNCVHYYYLTKKSVNYKALVKKHARRRRDKAERQQRYRAEADHQSHQPTGDQSVKLESSLAKNFIEFNSLIKEEQQHHFYSQECDNHTVTKDAQENKNGATNDENKSLTSDTIKTNKNNGSSCSELNTLNKNYRGPPDNDDDYDENYRSRFTNEFGRDSESRRTSELSGKVVTTEETERDRTGDMQSDSQYNSSRQMSDCDLKPSNTKHEHIHIKDAIEYSIEQNLCQNVENNINKVYDKKLFENNPREEDHSFGFTNTNLDESTWKKNNILDNNDNCSFKYNYFPQKDSNIESGNTDSPMRFNSSFNRAILMKDFCTAQMMNQIPITSSINPKLQTMSFTNSSNVHSIDVSRSISPDRLPTPEVYKPKIPSATESIDPYIATISGLSNSSMKKSDFFIDRVSKLYEEEVEPYTDEFRNRSDSQRTRTSSEASEMYAYIKNRSQKNIHSPKKVSTTNSLTDKTSSTVVDSRIKMPPPDVTDQKVFRSQKSSFSSKKNPYLKSSVSKETVFVDDLLAETGNKRKIITAANIIDSLTDKTALNDDNDMKFISSAQKLPEKPFAKLMDLSDEKCNKKPCFSNNSQMTLDGHIKQLIVDDYDSTKRNDVVGTHVNNSNDVGRETIKHKTEIARHKCNMPLKKRDQPSSISERTGSPNKLKPINKSSTLPSAGKVTKIGNETNNNTNTNNNPMKQLFEKNNNSINYKEKLDISIADCYDSQSSPQFSSPGKLFIDLDNNVDGV